MRLARTLIAFACALVLLAGHAWAESVLRVRQVDDLRGFDPIYTSDYMVRDHGYLVYDTLFAMDSSSTPRPQMVDTWSVSSDGLLWTFHLRPGLAFSDGQKVTAADVTASLARWSQRDGMGQMLAARWSHLETVDDDTFRIVMNQPWGLVLEALAKPSSMVPFIMPARVVATPADKQITDPTGSGPYVMRRDLSISGSKIVYERNSRYIPRAEPADGLSGGKHANFDRIEWLILPDPATASAALQKGEIDIFDGVPPDLAPLLAKTPGVKLMPSDSAGQLIILRMNQAQPPFDNPKMRQALRYAIEQTEFREAYSDDPAMAQNCDSFFACTSPYATTAGWSKPDLERARQLVRESGYDGKPVPLLDVADYLTHIHAVLVEQLLRQIGVTPELLSSDSTTWVARRAKREGWSLAVVAPSGMDAADPVSNFALRANCDKAWYGWPCDDKLETLRAQWADARDVATRKQLAEQIQLRALDVGPYWPLGMVFGIRGYRADLRGFLKTPVPVYWNISR